MTAFGPMSGRSYDRFGVMTKTVLTLWTQNITPFRENQNSEKLKTLWMRNSYDRNSTNAMDVKLYDDRRFFEFWKLENSMTRSEIRRNL